MAMDRVALSKKLSWGLRHDPGGLGIRLDESGWADVEAVIAALGVAREDLEEVVRTSEKKRFAFDETGTKIRASQGHSVDVDLGLERRMPPEVLFHGTVARFVDSIREEGLSRGQRTYVHLSAELRTAEEVGRRRGTAIVLKVLARAMHEAGFTFHVSENGVWLTEHVPPRFLEIPPPTSQRWRARSPAR